MGNVIYVLLSMLLLGCSANKPVVLADDTKVRSGKYFSGQYKSNSGQQVMISQSLDKSRIVIFSQSFCHTCQAETEMLVTYFAGQGGMPKNLEILTILVGEIADDANDFIDKLNIPWPVGFIDDPEVSLFRKYCEKVIFPCTVVETPQEGIVLISHTKFTIDLLQSYTGKWEF